MQPGDRMHTRLDRGVYQPGVGDTRVTGGDEAGVEPAVEEAEVEHAAEEAGSQELPVQQEVTTVRRSARERRQRVMFGSWMNFLCRGGILLSSFYVRLASFKWNFSQGRRHN